MSLFSGAAAYTRLLRLPDARRAVVASCTCRLSYGMLSLALLLVVEHATGSFAVAGAAGAAISLAGLTAPAKARFIGSRPQRWAIGGLGAAYATSLLALVVLGAHHLDTPLPLVALGATAGLATVPIGPMMRARWARVVPADERRRAYALDVALEDSLFFAGPLVAGVLVAADGPGLALAASAGCYVAGIGLLVLTPSPSTAPGTPGSLDVSATQGPSGAPAQPGPSSAPATPGPSGRPPSQRLAGLLGVLRSGRLAGLLGLLLATATGSGVIDVAVTARAVGQGRAAAAGVVFAAIALGSVVGGLVWGHLPHRHGRGLQLAGLTAVVAATLAAGSLTANLVVLGAVLAVGGAALSPLLVLAYLAVDELAGGIAATVTATWANTAFNAGGAAGGALGGAIVATAGPAVAFAAGAASPRPPPASPPSPAGAWRPEPAACLPASLHADRPAPPRAPPAPLRAALPPPGAATAGR